MSALAEPFFEFGVEKVLGKIGKSYGTENGISENEAQPWGANQNQQSLLAQFPGLEIVKSLVQEFASGDVRGDFQRWPSFRNRRKPLFQAWFMDAIQNTSVLASIFRLTQPGIFSIDTLSEQE